jgi:hypothetical protein
MHLDFLVDLLEVCVDLLDFCVDLSGQKVNANHSKGQRKNPNALDFLGKVVQRCRPRVASVFCGHRDIAKFSFFYLTV